MGARPILTADEQRKSIGNVVQLFGPSTGSEEGGGVDVGGGRIGGRLIAEGRKMKKAARGAPQRACFPLFSCRHEWVRTTDPYRVKAFWVCFTPLRDIIFLEKFDHRLSRITVSFGSAPAGHPAPHVQIHARLTGHFLPR
jgi:hypothetical protein